MYFTKHIEILSSFNSSFNRKSCLALSHPKQIYSFAYCKQSVWSGGYFNVYLKTLMLHTFPGSTVH